MNKKICIPILAAALTLLTMQTPALAASQSYDFAAGMPAGWTLTNANSQIEVNGESGETAMALKCDTSAGMDFASAEVKTDIAVTGGEPVAFHLRMAADRAGAEVQKEFCFVKGYDMKDLFLIQGQTLNLFGTSVQVPMGTAGENPLYFDLDLALDFAADHAVAWLDGVKVYDGAAGFAGYSFAGASLNFMHWYPPVQTSAIWYVSALDYLSGASYRPSSVPQAGSSFVDAQAYQNITVDFGCLMSLSGFANGMALESAPAGTTAFQAEAADWKRNGARLTVTPKAGLLPEREYRLSFSALQDVFGVAKEPFSVAFSTAPSGYQGPKAVILTPQDGAACVAGYPTAVRAKVTQGTSPLTRAELYANGQAVQTLTAAPWEFAYTPAQADRTDELFLRVYDQAGGMIESERVRINVVTNQAPDVRFTSLAEGQTLEPGAQVAVQASDSDGGVERIAFYIDGELIAEAEGETAAFAIPQEISFAKHVVKAVAYDIYGAQGSASAGVVISKLLRKAVYESDFSGYTGTKENPGSITGFALVSNRNEKQEHYIMNGTVDEAHGNSVILGSDSKTAGNSCWAGINVTAAAPEKILLKTSLYFQSTKSETHLILRNADGSAFVEDVIFYNGQIQYCNGAEKYTMPMKTGTWYEIEYEIDLAGNSYALTVNGQEVAKDYQFGKKLGSLSSMRVDINNRDTQPAWIAVAKFQVYRIYAFPYITGARLFCGDADVTEQGQLTADKITLQMNGAVSREMFTVKEMLLTGDGSGIPADWEWNGDQTQLELKLRYPLEPEYLYKMQMNYQHEGKAYTTVLPLQMPPSLLGAKSAAFETGDGTIRFTAELVNDTLEDREVTVLLVKYDHGVLADFAQQQMTIPAGGAHISSPALVYEQGEGVTYEAFLWDDWQNRLAINNKFYQP